MELHKCCLGEAEKHLVEKVKAEDFEADVRKRMEQERSLAELGRSWAMAMVITCGIVWLLIGDARDGDELKASKSPVHSEV